MLIFTKYRLTYLATPKTGSTALELALRPRADIIFTKGRKHMTARRFADKVAPFIATTYGIQTETVAVMRAPLEQIKSWYSYRARADLKGSSKSTEGVSFDRFVMALISDAPPDYAQIGSQFRFLTDNQGALAVDHLFAYEQQAPLLAFLSHRLETPVVPKRKNTSPAVSAPLSHKVAEALGRSRGSEFALHDRLMAAGGYLTRL